MNRFELRQSAMDAMQKEASNGIWQEIQTDKPILLCVRDMLLDDTNIGRLEGLVQAWKSIGDVQVSAYVPPDMDDDGSYIQVKITPRL